MLRSCFLLSNSILRKSIRSNNLNAFNRFGLIHLNGRQDVRFCTTQKANNPNASSLVNLYKGALSTQIRMVKVFSLSTSVMGIICQPLLYAKAQEIGGATAMIAVCSVVGFFTFVTPFLLHILTRKYVINMDYNADTKNYIATIVTFFLRHKKITFKAQDVDVPDVPGMFTSFIVKDTPLFVDFRQMKDPTHYAKIMGFDKPLDLKLDKLSSIIAENNAKKQS